MDSKNIRAVSDALLCSNCGACKAICPKDAISFSVTALGRIYAVVDENCVNCGLCVNVCPTIDMFGLHKLFQDRFVGDIIKVYVGKSTDKAIFENAQSGGACTAILTYLFDTCAIDCAVLCKMDYGNPPKVKSVVVEDKKLLAECQRSCYTPVDILSSLKMTKNKKSVAVVGLPCHIQGVENLMRQNKKFHNIKYKLGLICDRTLCAGLERVVLSYSNQKGKNDIKIIWRDKTPRVVGDKKYCYKTAPIRLQGEDGFQDFLPNSYRFALKDYFTSPRCRVCYDKLNTCADIVLGDPWGMSDVDWQKGMSVVVTRTPVGQQLISEMMGKGLMTLTERATNELLIGQHIEQRRKQVAVCSQALSPPCKINTYLCNLGNGVELDSSKARKSFEDFVRRDSLTEEQILHECQTIIKRNELRATINRWFVVRAIRKIIETLKRR